MVCRIRLRVAPWPTWPRYVWGRVNMVQLRMSPACGNPIYLWVGATKQHDLEFEEMNPATSCEKEPLKLLDSRWLPWKLTSQTCSEPQLILLRNFQLQLGVPHFQPAQQPVFPGSPNGVGRWRNFPGNQSIHHLCDPQATSGYCAATARLLRSDPILGPSWTILKLQVK
jgi:hypothetical protein